MGNVDDVFIPYSFHIFRFTPLCTFLIRYQLQTSAIQSYWLILGNIYLLGNEIHRVEEQVQILLSAACQYHFSIFCNKYATEMLTEIPILASGKNQWENWKTLILFQWEITDLRVISPVGPIQLMTSLMKRSNDQAELHSIQYKRITGAEEQVIIFLV